MNTTLVHADIFFFVSTILFSIFAIVFIVFLFYAISIAREVRRVVKLVREGAEKVSADLSVARERLREVGEKIPAGILTILSGLWTKKKKKK
jgi:predicted PurR-regulated permease PerM